jgi:hypothetical protein
VNVTQRDNHALVCRNVDACDAGQVFSPKLCKGLRRLAAILP